MFLMFFFLLHLYIANFFQERTTIFIAFRRSRIKRSFAVLNTRIPLSSQHRKLENLKFHIEDVKKKKKKKPNPSMLDEIGVILYHSPSSERGSI